MQNVFAPHKPGTAKPRVLAPLPNSVELGENGRKTVTKTVPSTVRCTVVTVLPLKTILLRVLGGEGKSGPVTQSVEAFCKSCVTGHHFGTPPSINTTV